MKNGVNELKITGNYKRQSEMIGNKALHFDIVMFGIALKN
jgi:hypothetical protein